jgi:formylglycine-generating enzyme required for sulfatase activity/tRNA A-37 threonylcarbamoyl transferase component Bud32
MTSDETKLEDDSPEEEERTRLEGSDPNETALEGGVGKRSEGFGSVGQSFEGTEKSYLVLEELEASGAEADVYVVEEQGSEDKRVLKYYRRGIRPKAEITEMLAGLDKEHVVQVYETGEKDGRSYEIQEFVEHGSLADMMTSGGLPDARMKEILHELLIAVEHLHERNVIHRDIKPANVLVRTLDPLDLVFIDFGIASQTEHSLHATSASRTVTYASPEALTGVVAKASDWWSVGVVLLELLTGKHPFAGLNEQAVNFQLVSKGIEVPSGIAGDWQLLLKGLLTRDREKRWGAMQVRQWPEGERSMATGYDADHADERETKKYDYKPYKFAGKEHHEPASLAEALGEHWNNGVKNFARGFVADWVKNEYSDIELTNHLMDVEEDETLDPSQRLSVVLMVLNGELPLLDKEGVLSRESLPSRASGLAGILTSGLGRWLKELRGDDWLVELGKEYEDFWKHIDRYREHLDEGLANRLFILDEEVLEGKWEELLVEYGGCTVSGLNDVFKAENPKRIDRIAILSLPRELLKTQGEIAPEGEEFTVSGLSLEMLWCNPGVFQMGSTEKTLHEVTLTSGYYLGKHVVTQSQWEKVMGSNPSHFKGADRPVEQVTWTDVTSFCEKLTELERKAGRLPEGMSYQLPTEAQWEYACRAGTKTAYAFGAGLTAVQANIASGLGKTSPVGSYKPNPWGFFDMHGNVWEWCADWYGDYPSGADRDPVGPAVGSCRLIYRVLRGGSWNSTAFNARSGLRDRHDPAYDNFHLGFRLSLRPTSK